MLSKITHVGTCGQLKIVRAVLYEDENQIDGMAEVLVS